MKWIVATTSRHTKANMDATKTKLKNSGNVSFICDPFFEKGLGIGLPTVPTQHRFYPLVLPYAKGNAPGFLLVDGCLFFHLS